MTFRNYVPITLLWLCCAGANAATFCVSTTAEFQSAYETAKYNGESNVIHMRNGTYLTPAGGIGSDLIFDFDYEAPGSLTIDGGWSPFLYSNCGFQSFNPGGTVIDGGDANKGLFISASSKSPSLDVTISNITFQGGKSVIDVEDDRGGGLRIEGPAGYAGDILVERCVFRDNQAKLIGGALSISSSGSILVRNNLFVGNSAPTAAALYALDNGSVVSLVNNTIVENTATSSSNLAAALSLDGTAPRVLTNNLIWHNTVGSQTDVYGPMAILVDNLVEKVSGAAQAGSAGNFSADPKFQAALDFRLMPDSPAANRGTDNPFGGLPAKDLDGAARIIGASVDVGAYESSVLLRDSFE